MKVVVDTNVTISALLFKGKSRIAYDYCVEHCDLFTSTFLLGELKEKLSGKFKLTSPIIKRTMRSLELVFEQIEPTTALPQLCRDPDDNHVLQLCESIKADYLITGDNDLIVLKRYKETAILNPNDFLNIVIKL